MSVSRRRFLKLTTAAAAGAGVTVVGANRAEANDPTRVTVPYVQKIIAHEEQLQENTPVAFSFPDTSSPCALIKLGSPVPGGVGPQGDIVAFSTLCTHMGCPVSYDIATRVFNCPCHFTIFDAEKRGQMVCGQATANLPAIVLEYHDREGTIRAVAVDGLIYGRQANRL